MAAVMDEAQFDRALQSINDNVNDDDKELFVAIVALVISVVALIASLLQVAQQYYASAAGYSNCDSKVIGKWSQSTRRILKPAEFRFEVQFEAPVIFLCRPENQNGPVKKQPIFHIDGSKDSLENTWTDMQSTIKTQDQASQSDKEIKKQAVHTADNELASWVTLLSALQQMEHDSRLWQASKYQDMKKPQQPPKASVHAQAPEDIKEDLEAISKQYTLTVAVQKKPRSWDTMPSNVKKPYATTTWCHIVEMLALLGVYWVEFDRTNDRYRGEGNGYTVTGNKVSDLGIMFSFQVHGRNRFQNNRVIPVDEVKELCFGFVPTIYKSKSDHRRLDFPGDDSRGLSILKFASKHEIAETLVLIGCNTNTVNYFSGGTTATSARVSHLFPIAFEIVGMLARTLHIERSAFRRLPNPTVYRWDTKNFDLRRLLTAYAFQMRNLHGGQMNRSSVTKQIWRHLKILQDHINKLSLPALPSESGSWLSLPLMDALHAALDDADKILTLKKKERYQVNREYTTISKLNGKFPQSQKATQQTDHPQETPSERKRREMVQYVLRSHIQQVLAGFNPRPGKSTEKSTDGNTSAGTTKPRTTKPRFEDIDAAAPELKQDKLMEVYFRVVRRRVRNEAQKSTDRREEEKAPPPRAQTEAPPGHKLRPRKQTGLSTRTSNAVRDESEYESDQDVDEDTTIDDLPEMVDDGAIIDLLDEGVSQEITPEDIWCTLVFRMICWLMLHDFHKNDIQMSKSELFGSRLPVYIA